MLHFSINSTFILLQVHTCLAVCELCSYIALSHVQSNLCLSVSETSPCSLGPRLESHPDVPGPGRRGHAVLASAGREAEVPGVDAHACPALVCLDLHAELLGLHRELPSHGGDANSEACSFGSSQSDLFLPPSVRVDPLDPLVVAVNSPRPGDDARSGDAFLLLSGHAEPHLG